MSSQAAFVDECYSLAIDLIGQGGRLAMEGYHLKETSVKTKLGEWDVATYYDEAIEKLLIEGIKSKFPDHL